MDDKNNTGSFIVLEQDFFNEIIKSPVPVDLNVIKLLNNSSLALDIYIWLTYRMSYLSQKTCIPWEALHAQFGLNYALDKSGRYAFKKRFSEQMLKVLALYPDAKVQKEDKGLILFPSKTHVSKSMSPLVFQNPQSEHNLTNIPKIPNPILCKNLQHYEAYKINEIIRIIKMI